jgi:hypothetical protein
MLVAITKERIQNMNQYMHYFVIYNLQNIERVS